MLKLFVLTRAHVYGEGSPSVTGDRDGMLVAARSEEDARALAMEKDGDECWASPTHQAPATCLMVGTATEETRPGVLMEAMACHFW
jgi:hypothetical protein